MIFKTRHRVDELEKTSKAVDIALDVLKKEAEAFKTALASSASMVSDLASKVSSLEKSLEATASDTAANLKDLKRCQDAVLKRLEVLERAQCATYAVAYERLKAMIAHESMMHSEAPTVINLR